MSNDKIDITNGSHPERPIYIEGVGWRYPVKHRMTRWPEWKDSHKPGTYMVTLNVNGGQRILGYLAGSTAVVYQWMKEHPKEVLAAGADPLYYRHALLGNRAMPFVRKTQLPAVETAGHMGSTQIANENLYPSIPIGVPITPSSGLPVTPSSGVSVIPSSGVPVIPSSGLPVIPSSGLPVIPSSGSGVAVAGVGGCSSFGGVSTPAVSSSRPRTHFPFEALGLPGAPHVVLSALGEQVKECWERMAVVEPGIELVCLTIMPNHLHAIIAVRRELKRAIGSVLRSFMGVTSHILHNHIREGMVRWNTDAASLTKKSSAERPSLWSPGCCIGICQSEEKLHTRIGYVFENPFFGILEGERHNFMERTMLLTIAGREYCGYGNMLLLKEPDRIQVFCHRRDPVTREPYHLTKDFQEERDAVLKASKDGVVIITPGISPGESEIMWAVLRSGGSVINLRKDEIPLTDRWHPSKERRLYCSQGHMLVLSVRDLPQQTFRDRYGNVIPADSSYARFHHLNLVAEELCSEGIEHQCVIKKR